MREKLNSNPMAQAGLILVLLLAVGFFLLKGGGEEGEEAAVSTEPVVTETATPELGSESVSSTTAAVTAPLPAPPLPRDVTTAYNAGKVVVLLVLREGGIDDDLAQRSVAGLSSMPDTAVFVVPVSEVSRYAAITLGVDVNRVPALIVMRPKRLSKGTPEASISYGFQTPESAEQAVRDARYDGPVVSYHPE